MIENGQKSRKLDIVNLSHSSQTCLVRAENLSTQSIMVNTVEINKYYKLSSIQMFFFKGLPKLLFARSFVGDEELFVYPFKQLPAWSNFTLKYGSNSFNLTGTTVKSEFILIISSTLSLHLSNLN